MKRLGVSVPLGSSVGGAFVAALLLAGCASGESEVDIAEIAATLDGGSASDASIDVQTGPQTDAGGPTGQNAMDSSAPDVVVPPPRMDSSVEPADTGATGADGGAGDAAPDAPASCGSPSGTYTGSCTNCEVTGTTLSCSCQTGSGSQTQTTTLDLCTCPVLTEISNSHGTLSCCGVPGGSYTSNCSNCTVVDATLSCTCLNNAQMPSMTTLNLCSCSDATQIADTNGQLTCP